MDERRRQIRKGDGEERKEKKKGRKEGKKGKEGGKEECWWISCSLEPNVSDHVSANPC